jgi:AbiV family abortive infection protein
MKTPRWSPAQLLAFKIAIFTNAVDLISDAELLIQNGRFPRALSVSVLATEELAKVFITWRLHQAVNAGDFIDWPDVNKSLRDHEIKLSLITMMMRAYDRLLKDGRDAAVAGLRGDGPEAFRYARSFNRIKQDGFYVGLTGTRARVPSTLISKGLAENALNVPKYLLDFLKLVDKELARVS